MLFADLYTQCMRYPRLVLTLLALLAVFLGSFIPKLQIDASSDSLVLEGDQSLEIYREVYKEYGTSSEFLFVTYRPQGDIFTEKVMQNVQLLQQRLKALPGVRDVMSYMDVPLLYSPPVTIATFSDGVNYLRDGNVNIELARKEFRESPIYRNLLTNQEQTVTALQVNLVLDEELAELRKQRDELRLIPNKTAEQQRQLKQIENAYELSKARRTEMEEKLVADVRAVLEQHRKQGAAIFLGGLPMIIADMLDYVRADMKVFGSMIIVFIVAALSLFFRSPRWVVLPLLTCILTCVYMLGGIALLGLKLTVISANFVALLLIITLAIAIHLVVRFVEYEKTEPEWDQLSLVLKSTHFMFKPCAYTTVTTMVAFMSLVISDIRPVIDFGWMMTIAVGVALVVSFLLIPAGLLILPRSQQVKQEKIGGSFTRRFAHFTEKHGTLLTIACVLVLLFSISGISQLQVENRFIDYFDDETEIYQGMLEIDAELGGTLPLDIIINHKTPVIAAPEIQSAASSDAWFEDDFFGEETADDFASDIESPYALSYWFSRQGMQDIQKIHQYLESIPEVGKVLSLATLYDVMNDLVGGGVDDIQLALMKENLSGEIDEALIQPYLSSDGMQTRISLRVKETSKTLSRAKMLQDVEQFLQQQGYQAGDYQLTGMMVMYNNVLQSLFTSQAATLGVVFVVIWLMMGVLFKSLYVSFLGLIPNVLAAFFVLGGMGWANIPLDMMTITIASITIGIGVDDTIHYVHRFKKELVKDGDYIAAMYRSHASIGLAMFYTSVTVIVGFAILTLSNFTPSIYFGFLTGIAMLTALLGSLLVLPHLLVVLKPFKLASES